MNVAVAALIAMNENDNFALVQKPPGALEKAEPGAKRILSGMVAETLALVKKEPPIRIVLVGDDSELLETAQTAIRDWRKDATVLLFRDGNKAWDELMREDPDALITDTMMYKSEFDTEGILELLAVRNVKYPIIVLNGFFDQNYIKFLLECAGPSLNTTILCKPFDSESLLKALQSGANISRDSKDPVETTDQPRRTRPPRIVVVDDDEGPRDAFELLIRRWFKDVSLLLFSNSSEAWQELLRTDPDLLILDMPLAEPELLPLLAERKVKYPILATSGFVQRKEVRQRAGPNLNVTFLRKPFSVSEFYRQLLIHLGPGDNPERQILKSEP
jgi:DNA-binding NtrC family response regulator